MQVPTCRDRKQVTASSGLVAAQPLFPALKLIGAALAARQALSSLCFLDPATNRSAPSVRKARRPPPVPVSTLFPHSSPELLRDSNPFAVDLGWPSESASSDNLATCHWRMLVPPLRLQSSSCLSCMLFRGFRFTMLRLLVELLCTPPFVANKYRARIFRCDLSALSALYKYCAYHAQQCDAVYS